MNHGTIESGEYSELAYHGCEQLAMLLLAAEGC
jgi:hypothetical protein